MHLYIQIKDGLPFENPIIEENLLQVYPFIDTNNLPSNLAKFERLPPPRSPSVYEKIRCEYEIGVDGVCRDTWYYDAMTQEEIVAKQDLVKQTWLSSQDTFKSWVFNEEKCMFLAPIPFPVDGKRYKWDEPTLSWIEVVV